MDYTKEQTRAMLAEAAVLVMPDASYRIDYVPAFDDEDQECFIATDEEDGDQVSILIDEVDLSSPDVLLYKLTLMNQ
jgi:hypothetical protein